MKKILFSICSVFIGVLSIADAQHNDQKTVVKEVEVSDDIVNEDTSVQRSTAKNENNGEKSKNADSEDEEFFDTETDVIKAKNKESEDEASVATNEIADEGTEEEFFDTETDIIRRLENQTSITKNKEEEVRSIINKIYALNYVTDKSLRITPKSFNELKDSIKTLQSSLQLDVATPIVNINPYDYANYVTAIEQAVSHILAIAEYKESYILTNVQKQKEQQEDKDIINRIPWYEIFKENKQLLKCMKDLNMHLSTLNNKGVVNLDEKEQAVAYKNVLVSYASILNIMNNSENLKSDAKYTSCIKFIESAYDITKQIYAAYYAKKFISEVGKGSKKQVKIVALEEFIAFLNTIAPTKVTVADYTSAIKKSCSHVSIDIENSLIKVENTNTDMSQLSIEVFYALQAYVNYLSNNGTIDAKQLQLDIAEAQKESVDNKESTERSTSLVELEKYLKLYKVLPNEGVALEEVSKILVESNNEENIEVEVSDQAEADVEKETEEQANNEEKDNNDNVTNSKEKDILKQQSTFLFNEGVAAYNTMRGISALKYITERDIVVTSETLEEFNNDPTKAIIHIDLYDGSNYITVVANALNAILKENFQEMSKFGEIDDEVGTETLFEGELDVAYVSSEQSTTENDDAKTLVNESLKELDNNIQSTNKDNLNIDDEQGAEQSTKDTSKPKTSWYLAIQKYGLEKELTDIKNSLEFLEGYGAIDLSDENQQTKYANVLMSFKTFMDKVNKNEEFIKNNPQLYEFLQLSQKFLSLVLVRYSTEKTLTEVRKSLEQIQHHTLSKSTKIPVISPILNFINRRSGVNVKAIDLGVAGYINQLSQGSSAFSFCSVDNHVGVEGTMGLHINLARIGGSIDYAMLAFEVYYSLEAYMDYLNSDGLVFIDRLQSKIYGMKGALADRRGMQRLEKELLKQNGAFERYLKVLNVIPQTDVVVDWIDITQAIAKDKVKGISKKVSLEASFGVMLAGLDIRVQSASDIKSYVKNYSILSMINSDCHFADEVDAKDMEAIIGKEYSLIRKPKDLFEKISKLNKTFTKEAKLSSRKSVKDAQNKEEVLTEQEQGALVNALLGYLSEYVIVLEQLAIIKMGKSNDVVYSMLDIVMDEVAAVQDSIKNLTNFSKKKVIALLESKKHTYEKLLLPKGKKGRENVLKTMVFTAAELRNALPQDNPEYNLRFKKLYEQIVRLGKLCKFAKNHSDKEISNTATMRSKEFRLDFDANVVGKNLAAHVVKKVVNDSPVLPENGKYITLTYELPIATAGVIGMYQMQQKCKKVLSEISSSEKSTHWTDELKDFGNIASGLVTKSSSKETKENLIQLKAISSIVNSKEKGQSINTLKNVVIPGLVMTGFNAYQGYNYVIAGSSQFDYTWKYIDPTPENIQLKPLPFPDGNNKEVIKNQKGKWVLDNVMISSRVNVGDYLYVGKVQKRTGSNTLHDLMAKYSVLSKGLIDSKSGSSTVLDTLLEEQTDSILKMFRKIACNEGNITYEFQMLYNDLIALYDEGTKEYNEITDLFKEFIGNCQKISVDKEENFKINENEQDNEVSSQEALYSLLNTSDDDKRPTSKPYETALKSFRKILDKQYNLIFLPHYNNAFDKVSKATQVVRGMPVVSGQAKVKMTKLGGLVKTGISTVSKNGRLIKTGVKKVKQVVANGAQVINKLPIKSK